MKPSEAIRRVRETRSAGGDEEVTAWACATQLPTDDLHRIAALWLVESARNAERSEVRQIERSSVSQPHTANYDAIKANVTRVYAHEPPDAQEKILLDAAAADSSSRIPRRNTYMREVWENVVPAGIEYRKTQGSVAARDSLKELQDWATEAVERMHLDWKRDLLMQTFVVDGVRTTWGEASIGQHRVRADQFLRSAAASADGAVRHLRAVTDLEASNAFNLNALVGAAETTR